MAISGLIAPTPGTAPGYLIYSYSADDGFLSIWSIMIGSLVLVGGAVLWSGVTLPRYCRRLIKHPAFWDESIQNYCSRSAGFPGLMIGLGAGVLLAGTADACTQVSWLHPMARLLRGAAGAFAAFAAAYFPSYGFVSLPNWLRPKAHRCQVRRAGSAQNRATLMGLYADPDDLETFERTGALPPRRPTRDPAEDWLRARGPRGEAAVDELQRRRDDELHRRQDGDRF